MVLAKLYGWYSLNAYINGEREYIYINLIGQETHCTIISTDKIYQLSYHDAVFMGELEPVSGTAPYIARTH